MIMLVFLPLQRQLDSVVKIMVNLYFPENSVKHFQQAKDSRPPAKKATFLFVKTKKPFLLFSWQ